MKHNGVFVEQMGDVTIHPTAIIEPYCILGSQHGPLVIGEGSVIRSHTVIEGGCEIGNRLETGHYTLIRTGNQIGENLRLGSYSSLEGGATIGDFVRIHGRCEMTGGTMKHFSRMHLNSCLTDNRLPPSNVNEDAIMDEGSVLCAAVIVVAGVRIGLGSFVGASICVTKDIPDAMALVGGKLKPITDLHWKGYCYPWTGYYAHNYPVDAQKRIERLHERIMACLHSA